MPLSRAPCEVRAASVDSDCRNLFATIVGTPIKGQYQISYTNFVDDYREVSHNSGTATLAMSVKVRLFRAVNATTLELVDTIELHDSISGKETHSVPYGDRHTFELTTGSEASKLHGYVCI